MKIQLIILITVVIAASVWQAVLRLQPSLQATQLPPTQPPATQIHRQNRQWAKKPPNTCSMRRSCRKWLSN